MSIPYQVRDRPGAHASCEASASGQGLGTGACFELPCSMQSRGHPPPIAVIGVRMSEMFLAACSICVSHKVQSAGGPRCIRLPELHIGVQSVDLCNCIWPRVKGIYTGKAKGKVHVKVHSST